MSLKSTLAHGDGWHFYESFEDPGLMFLRINGVTLTVTKDVAKGMLVALEKLEARDWVLYSEEDGNTPDAIENQIKWLEEQLHKKKSNENIRVWALKAEEGIEFTGPLAVPGPQFNCAPPHPNEDWVIEDESDPLDNDGDLKVTTEAINDREYHRDGCTDNTSHCGSQYLPMRKLIVLLDMDGIVTDLLETWIGAINKKFHRSITMEDVNQWDIGELKQTKDIGGKVYKMIQKPMFFWDLKPLPGSVAAVKSLVDAGHQVLFLTKPAGPQSAYEKLLWVDRHFPFVGSSNVILTKFKHLVKGDVFLDDSADNIISYVKANPEALVLTFEYAYNRVLSEHPGVKIAGKYTDYQDCWDNALAHINELANR